MVGTAEELTWYFHPGYYVPLKAIPWAYISNHALLDIARPSSSCPSTVVDASRRVYLSTDGVL